MSKNLCKIAKEGDLEKLINTIELAGGDDIDDLVYRWLCVADDFGHEEAGELADDMLETSSLRYDDDHFVIGSIHFDLGKCYFFGKDNLPKNSKKAFEHMNYVEELKYREGLDIESEINEIRFALNSEDRLAFDKLFPER